MPIKFPDPQKFLARVARLKKKEKLFLAIAAAFVSLAFLDRLIIAPILSKMASLNKQLQDIEAGIKKDVKIVAQKNRIRSEEAQYATYFQKQQTEDEEMTALLKEVESLADKCAVYIVDMKPAGAKNLGSTKKHYVNVSCEATMEQLVTFMFAVESSTKLLVIDKYAISPKSKDSESAKCTLTIAKVVLPKGSQ